MTNRERFLAVMRYEPYDRLPLVHFGFWTETLEKWVAEGHITEQERIAMTDGSETERAVCNRLGFDFNYFTMMWHKNGFTPLDPVFERKIIGTTPDGFQKVQNEVGVIELHRGNAGSIPAEIGHILEDRESWEKEFLPRLTFRADRITEQLIETYRNRDMTQPMGIYCGSMFGNVRDFMGLEGASYLYVDDEELFAEIITTLAEMWRKCLTHLLEGGAKPDFGHYWEDICCKSGPLISPAVFEKYCVPEYQRTNELLKKFGIDIISVDCDGCIDTLVPLWIKGGVNTMFPIEVGTWGGNLALWRGKYGKQLRGVGGMIKYVFEQDYAAVDKEIERLRPLVELGGYIPCPDHRITPQAKWENIQYYCDRMRKVFGKM